MIGKKLAGYPSLLAPLPLLGAAFVCQARFSRVAAVAALAWLVLPLAPGLGIVAPAAFADHMASSYLSPWYLVLPSAGFALLLASLSRAVPSKWRLVALGVVVLWSSMNVASSWSRERGQDRSFVAEIVRGDFIRPWYDLPGSRFYECLWSLPALRKVRPAIYEEVVAAIRETSPRSRSTLADLFSSTDVYLRPERYERVLDALSREGLRGFQDGLDEYGEALLDRLEMAAQLKDQGVDSFVAGRKREAIAQLERSVDLDHREPGALESLAAAYADTGRYRDALRLYDRLIILKAPDKEFLPRIQASRADALSRARSQATPRSVDPLEVNRKK